MPRKSTRTASTTYRRNHLMWVDLESLSVNRSYDDIKCAPKAGNPTQSIGGRFVTPSPTFMIAKKKESPQKRSPRTNLFSPAKKRSKRRRDSTTIVCESTFAQSEKLSTKVQKQLFARNVGVDASCATRKVDANFSSRRVPKNTSLPVATKSIKSGIDVRGKNHAGDSLASLSFFENIIPAKKTNSLWNKNDEFDCRNRPHVHPSYGEKEGVSNEQRKTITKSQLSIRKNRKASQIGYGETAKKDCTISCDEDKKTVIEKSEKRISDELVSLLALPSKKNKKKTRTRSTIEILDEFKKELKLKHGRRAILPRACKSTSEGRFREITSDEGTDGETDEDKNEHHDDESTKNKTVSKINKHFRDEESTWECSSIIRSPTNAILLGTNNSPLPNTLKTRPGAFFWSSSLIKNQSLSRHVNKLVASGLPSKKRRRSGSKTVNNMKQRDKNNLSTRLNREKTNLLSSNTLIRKRDSNPRSVIHRERTHEKKPQRESNDQQIDTKQEQRSNRSIFSNHTGIFPKCGKVQQQSTVREVEKELTISQKRVRFDSATTTFSVKIKIKTNLDAGRRNKNESGYDHDDQILSSLNESAVQAIANQVTQACLTQASTNAGTGDRRNPDINLNVDMNERQFSNQPSRKPYTSDKRGDTSVDGERKNDVVLKSYRLGTKGENGCRAPEILDDGRSITSDLTNDWNRSKPFRFNDHEYQFEREAKKMLDDTSTDPNICLVQKIRNTTNQHLNIADNIEKSPRYLKRNRHQRESIILNKTRSRRRLTEASTCGESQCHSSVSRKQLTWGCSDSLAGSQFGSISSVVAAHRSSNLPKEVSLRKCSELSMRRRTSQKVVDKRNDASTISFVDGDSNKLKRFGKIEESKVECIQDNPIKPTSSHKSLRSSMFPTYRCGECKGCRRIFDCQTCDACLEKLHFYGSTQITRMEEVVDLCLSRRCRRTCRVGFVDSLLSLKSSCNQHESKNQVDDKSELGNALFQDRLLHQKLVTNIMNINKKAMKDAEDSASKNMKVPWDDGDDWTVDYSYLCEPEYRPHWKKIGNSNGRMKSSLLDKGLSSVSFLSVNEKQKSPGFGRGGRTSLSSISESVVSQKISTKTRPSLSVQNEKGGKCRKKIGKRKRDPLHGVALPGVSSDVSSVKSWRANRRCLRALMEYDEADQDWE